MNMSVKTLFYILLFIKIIHFGFSIATLEPDYEEGIDESFIPNPQGACSAPNNADNVAQRNLALTTQDQRSYIAIAAEAGILPISVYRTIKKVFKKEAYSFNYVTKLYRQFQQRQRISTNRCSVPGRPRTSVTQNNEDRLFNLMEERRTWTTEEIAEKLQISYGSAYELLKKNNFKKMGPVWIPHELSCKDVQQRIDAAESNLQWFTNDARMLGRIIAIDETWIRSYNPLDPDQAAEWRLPGEGRPTRVRAGLWEWKIMLICAVHQDQIVAWRFLGRKETMDSKVYIRFLNESLFPYIEENSIHDPIILQDNARPHVSRATIQYIDEQRWSLLNHAPYSPDTNPFDYDVNQKIKRPLKGKRYETPEELIEEAEAVMRDLKSNHTLIGTTNLPSIWQQIIDRRGEYIS